MSLSSIPKDICDIEAGIVNMGNSRALFEKHLKKFMSNHEDLADQIQKLVDDSEYHKAAVLCHAVKGVSGMLALTSIQSHTASAEAMLKDWDNPDEEHLKLLDLTIDRIRADILELLEFQNEL